MTDTDYRGAESILILGDWFGYEVIIKQRLSKKYRIKELDYNFRKKRMIQEARLLVKAKEVGVRVPLIYEIDLKETKLVLEYIDGEIVKTILPKLSLKKQKSLGYSIGRSVGLLHNAGIIHGDLTTSNMIITNKTEQLVLIDFGLGYISDKIEDVGIDMYLLERALRNTHSEIFNHLWIEIMKGYKEIAKDGDSIERKISEISSRGRYSERV